MGRQSTPTDCRIARPDPISCTTEFFEKASQVPEYGLGLSPILAQAEALILRGEPHKARRILARAAQEADALGKLNPVQGASLFTEIGQKYFWLSDPTSALASLSRALEFGRIVSPDWGKAIALGGIALILTEYQSGIEHEAEGILSGIASEVETMQDFGS